MKLSTDQRAAIGSDILKRVRAHPGTSRIALSRNLKLAPSTVSNYVERLVTGGFLAESEKMDSESGRPPTALRLNPDGGQFIGVDFEARSIMATAVDFSARPLKQAHRDIQKSDSVPGIIRKIEQAILEVLPGNQERPLAIGVGVPGLVDPLKGIAVDYKYIEGWHNVALAAPLAKHFGVPVYLENTIRSMALAELWFGQGRGVRDWLCIGIRSGIGAGIVAGGQLQRGHSYQAGEIGRWRCPWPSRAAARLFANGDSAAAAPMAELQEVASARAILATWARGRAAGARKAQGPGQPTPVFADLVRAVQQNDALALQIITAAAAMLSWAVSQLSLALNPSRVILAGQLTLLGEALLGPLRQRAGELLRDCGADAPEIVNSTMGEYSGALGAAALAVHEWKPALSST
ncbi:MAG TPA: ROK family transcriptional regulator [Candidatus Acidoferrum sp.]|jgi:N-acetylglucosamine repressor|nr:ROK family transcriptional regulator [Candidatus Acidoferrum sp.]